MPKKKKSTDPSRWFRLSAYERTSTWNALDWYEAIAVRRILAGFLAPNLTAKRSGIESDKGAHIERDRQVALKFWQALRAKPLTADASIFAWAPSWNIRIADKQSLCSLQVVRDLTFLDIAHLAGELDLIARGRKRTELMNFIQHSDERHYQNWMAESIKAESVNPRFTTFAVVDIEAPDRVLEAAFIDWLKSTRANWKKNLLDLDKQSGMRSASSKFVDGLSAQGERDARKDWAKHQLLPIIDLVLDAEALGYRLPATSIAVQLGGKHQAEKVRDTWRPKAIDCLAQFGNKYAPGFIFLEQDAFEERILQLIA